MSSRPISSSGRKESSDDASCSPLTKRLRLSGADAGADDLDEGTKARRQSVAAILPPDIWARTLSHLAFGDVKQCTAVDRYMAFEVSPAIKYDANFTLKLGVPIPERVDLASVGRRFRGVKKAEIASTEESVDSDAKSESKSDRDCIAAPVLREIVSSITPNATSLKIVGLGDNCTSIDLSTALIPLRDHLEEISFQGSHVDLKTIALGLDGLQNLTRLEIILDIKMFRYWDEDRDERYQLLESFGASIGILGEINLPELTALKLVDPMNDDWGGFVNSPVVEGFHAGIGRIRKLKTLKSNVLGFSWSKERRIESFGSMLAKLTNLEILSTLDESETEKPPWDTFSPHLQRLHALTYKSFMGLFEDIRPFTTAMNANFVSLKTLKIIFEDMFIDEHELPVLLSELKKHPTLKTIILDVHFFLRDVEQQAARNMAKIIACRLQELIGGHVTVIVGEGGENSVEFD